MDGLRFAFALNSSRVVAIGSRQVRLKLTGESSPNAQGTSDAYRYPPTLSGEGMPKTIRSEGTSHSKNYKFPEFTSLLRPEVGLQAQIKLQKPPRTYRYDDSIYPAAKGLAI
jgi:hypothetical protein